MLSKWWHPKIGDFFPLGNLNAHHISWYCDKADTDVKLLFNHQTYNYYVSYLLDFLKTSPTDSRRWLTFCCFTLHNNSMIRFQFRSCSNIVFYYREYYLYNLTVMKKRSCFLLCYFNEEDQQSHHYRYNHCYFKREDRCRVVSTGRRNLSQRSYEGCILYFGIWQP